jgi:hypothetical protein
MAHFAAGDLDYESLTNMVGAVGTTKYTWTAGNQLQTEDGPFASDTITNTYVNRLRTKMDLQQPTGLWTNVFTYEPLNGFKA